MGVEKLEGFLENQMVNTDLVHLLIFNWLGPVAGAALAY